MVREFSNINKNRDETKTILKLERKQKGSYIYFNIALYPFDFITISKI